MNDERLFAVNLLWVHDPEYREAAKIRDRAVKLVIVTGRSVYGD